MTMLWIQFIASAFLIVLAGTRLTRSAETIAEHTGLGTLWAGVFLLPLATSLPELVTSWRAAAIFAPDLSLGNVFGSNMFNVAIIALIDLTHGPTPILARVSQRHIFTAAMGIIITCYVAITMIMPISVRIGWIGLETLALPFLYFFSTWLMARFEKRHACQDGAVNFAETGQSLRQAISWFLAAAVIIIFAGTSLADAGDAIALGTGLGRTLVGSFFIAITTSLPEVVTTFSAARRGVFDMAIGNIFGANLFNLVIIFFADAFYTGGNILSVGSPTHLVTMFMFVILTSIAVIGLIYRSQRCFVRSGYDSIAILAGYILGMTLLFLS